MKNFLRLFFEGLYDQAFPGLLNEWIRLCERFQATYGFNFDGKDFDRILAEFSEKNPPASMQKTIDALIGRKELAKKIAGAAELTLYAETLRNGLDEFADGAELHGVEVLYNNHFVRVRVVLYDAADAPEKRLTISQVAPTAIAGIELLGTDANGDELTFTRSNDCFSFSPALAQNDTNSIIGFVLENMTATSVSA